MAGVARACSTNVQVDDDHVDDQDHVTVSLVVIPPASCFVYVICVAKLAKRCTSNSVSADVASAAGERPRPRCVAGTIQHPGLTKAGWLM